MDVRAGALEEIKQMWKMVKDNDEEYFKLKTTFGYVLTAKSQHDLKIDRGLLFTKHTFQLFVTNIYLLFLIDVSRVQ